VLTATKDKTLNESARADLAAATQQAIVDVLAMKSLAALEQTGLGQLVVAGGVGANTMLRQRLSEATAKNGCRVYYPPLEFCTDNGAMIAFAGTLRLQQHASAADGSFTVKSRWPLETIVPASIA
jgi:N6-L-threonylcarbamoyladenine synthase